MTEKSDEQVELLHSIIKARFSKFLTSEDLERVKEDLRSIKESSDAMASVKLRNADEPFFVFKPYKGRKARL
jgi:hypothetical protein